MFARISRITDEADDRVGYQDARRRPLHRLAPDAHRHDRRACLRQTLRNGARGIALRPRTIAPARAARHLEAMRQGRRSCREGLDKDRVLMMMMARLVAEIVGWIVIAIF